MKTPIRLFVSLLLLLMTVQAKSQDPNFYIFLAFGQSNMEGQGAIGSQDKTVDSRFQVLQAVDCSNLERTQGQWYPAVPPLSRCWNGLGPADYFGRTLVETLPTAVRVGIINVSIGGCRIELFDKDIYQDYTNTFEEDWFQDAIASYGGNPYQHLIDMAKMAQKDGVIKGILLHQGESNNADTQWPEKVKKIYNDMITDLELEATEVPLLAGEMVHEDQGGALAGMNAIVGQLPDVLDNSYIISSSGCSDKDDNIHFDAAGYRELGKRYGEQMLSLLDYSNIPLGAGNTESINGYELYPTYPNPTSGIAHISFQLPKSTTVEIKLYNMTGAEMALIARDTLAEGKHEITYNFSSLPKGLYYYTLLSDEYQLSQRVKVE